MTTRELEKLKNAAGFNPFTWQGIIGRSPYAAPLWPKEYGGLSGEVWMQQVIRTELVQYRLPTVSINLLGVGLAGPTLIAHGTEAQKERYLRKILSAEEIWCQLFSEPGSGSDLASLSTRAVRDGDEWVINGQKVWTTIAQFAKFGMLLARTGSRCPQARRLVVLHPRHEGTRGRRSASQADDGLVGIQRGVLERRPHPRCQPRRRRGRRLALRRAPRS